MRISLKVMFSVGLLALSCCLGCSDTNQSSPDSGISPDSAPPLPQTLKVVSGKTTLEVGLNPLTFTLLHDGKQVVQNASAAAKDPWGPLALGQADPFQENIYYDPAAPPVDITWSAGHGVTTAQANGTTHVLTLNNGATLTLKPSTVSGAIQVEVAGTAANKTAKGPQTVLSRYCMSVADKEVFFGFGEVFDTVSSRGVVRPMQMMVDMKIDTGLNEVHVPVPLAISPRGWAMLVDDYHAGAFDVAKANKDRICATFFTHKLTMYLMTDEDPLKLVERTVSLSAKPALPPEWAFAPQQWRNVLDSQAQLMGDAADMRKLKVPGSVVWIDNPWQTGYNSFLFDQQQFPDAKGAMTKLHAMGYKVLVWSTPYVNVDQTTEWAEADQKGYLVKDTLGKSLAYKWSNGKGSLVDFSAPGATDFWRKLIKRVTDLGVDGFKLDYGEEAVVAVGYGLSFFRFHGGETPATMHRKYPGLYHETYLGALPAGKGFLITRAGSLGEQRSNTCIWPGDLDSNFTTHADGRVGGLPAAITGGLSLSASGYPFYGSDIGGYRKGLPTTELLLRWAEYAALGTIMQLGGGGKNHNPWDTTLYDKSALDHYRTYARLHTDLFPTIYSYAVKAAATGRPVTRPLGMAFPKDPQTWTRDFHYMLGDYLLVAPVITAGATAWKVYLPAGRWIHHWTRKAYTGPAQVQVPAPVGQIPLFRQEGAIVAYLAFPVDTLAPATDTTVASYEDHGQALLLDILPGAPSSSLELFDGAEITAATASAKVEVSLKRGKQFTDFRVRMDWKNMTKPPQTPSSVDVDAKALTQASSAAETATCTGGCWYYDPTEKMLHLRLPPAGSKVTVQ